jgi:hypothetical protein
MVENDQQDHGPESRETEGVLAKERLRRTALPHWATVLDCRGENSALCQGFRAIEPAKLTGKQAACLFDPLGDVEHS